MSGQLGRIAALYAQLSGLPDAVWKWLITTSALSEYEVSVERLLSLAESRYDELSINYHDATPGEVMVLTCRAAAHHAWLNGWTLWAQQLSRVADVAQKFCKEPMPEG